jgi:hypothetical protein
MNAIPMRPESVRNGKAGCGKMFRPIIFDVNYGFAGPVARCADGYPRTERRTALPTLENAPSLPSELLPGCNARCVLSVRVAHTVAVPISSS